MFQDPQQILDSFTQGEYVKTRQTTANAEIPTSEDGKEQTRNIQPITSFTPINMHGPVRGEDFDIEFVILLPFHNLSFYFLHLHHVCYLLPDRDEYFKIERLPQLFQHLLAILE